MERSWQAGKPPEISAHTASYRIIHRFRPGKFFAGFRGKPGTPGEGTGPTRAAAVQTGQDGATWDEARGAMLRAPFLAPVQVIQPGQGESRQGKSRQGEVNHEICEKHEWGEGWFRVFGVFRG